MFAASEDAYGTEVFSLVLQDDGGTDNGGVDTSTEILLTLTIRCATPCAETPRSEPCALHPQPPISIHNPEDQTPNPKP